MKSKYFLLLLMLSFQQEMYGQLIKSTVEGVLEVYSPYDSTNMFIGKEISNTIFAGAQNSDNTIVGNYAGSSLSSSATKNTFLGAKAGSKNELGNSNTFLGALAGNNIVNGGNNVFVGAHSGRNVLGSSNVFAGYQSGSDLEDAFATVLLGRAAGKNVLDMYNSVCIGTRACASEALNLFSFVGNVFIGYEAGLNETGSNKLLIENSSAHRDEALIYGDFELDFMQVNGVLRVNNSGGSNSRLRMKGAGGTFNDVIKYSSLTNDCVMGSVSGVGGRLFLCSNALTQATMLANGNFGIGTSTPTKKLEVDGNVLVSGFLQAEGDAVIYGTVQVGSFLSGSTDLRINTAGAVSTSTSDKNLKTNIATFQNALAKLKGLRGVSFKWKEDLEAGTQLGVIAQEVQQVIPEIVTESGGYLGVDYSEMSAVIIEAIKEQQALLQKQQSDFDIGNSKLDELTAKIEYLEKIEENKKTDIED